MKQESNQEPISEITLFESQTATDSYSLTARVKEGALVMEGYDWGDLPQRIVGDIDYEYWLTVDAEYVPSVLLWLIKDRFSSTSEFTAWLESKGIPSQFASF